MLLIRLLTRLPRWASYQGCSTIAVRSHAVLSLTHTHHTTRMACRPCARPCNTVRPPPPTPPPPHLHLHAASASCSPPPWFDVITDIFAEPDRETLELPAAAVEAVLSPRTRWVAVTAASNAVGTIPDLPGIVEAAHAAGARVFVDAVHATPHRPIDVAALGATRWRARPTSGSGRTSGSCGRAPSCWASCRPTSCALARHGARPLGAGNAALRVADRRAGGRRLRRAPRPRRAARPRGPPAGPDGRGPGLARRRDRPRRRPRPHGDGDVHRRRAIPRATSPPTWRAPRSPSGTATTTPWSSRAGWASSPMAPCAPASSPTTTATTSIACSRRSRSSRPRRPARPVRAGSRRRRARAAPPPNTPRGSPASAPPPARRGRRVRPPPAPAPPARRHRGRWRAGRR